jgi:antitoxin HigA-1
MIRTIYDVRAAANGARRDRTTANALALKLRVPSNRLSDIIRGERAISAETALRLGRSLGTGAQFWINLQAQYDLALAEQRDGARIDREVELA